MRASRKQSTADIYHVIARGTGRQLIFETEEDRRRFLKLMADALQETEADLYAWCLMNNHVHLLVHASLQDLADFMHRVCGPYAQWFNLKTGRVGHLFQERFKSEPISDDAYLKTVVRYIHENPEKGGVAPTSRYRWSSYREYVGSPGICRTDFVLGVFGGVEAFKRFHAEPHEDFACLEVDLDRSATRPMSDESTNEAVLRALGTIPVHTVKALPIERRNECIRALREAGLSIRQIERLTGLGRNTIARA